jgi:hypothetical protein
MNTPDTTVVPNIEESAAGSSYVAPVIPDLDRNWFNDPEIAAYIQQSVIPVVDWTRTQRTGLEAEWDSVRNMALQVHDSNRRYLGRSQVYLPAYARARTTLVAQLSRGVFPSDEYLDVTAASEETTDEEAKGVKALIQCEFEKNSQLRSNMKPFFRQLIDTGVSVGKFWYVKDEVKRGKFDLLRGMGGAPQYGVAMTKEGCRFKTNSIYGWHIFPVTANSLNEAQLVFEDIIVPKAIFDEKKKRGIWPTADEAFATAPPEMTQNQQNLLAANADMSHPLGDAITDTKTLGVRVVTEVWGSMVLPKKAYAQGEDSDFPVPVKISLAGHEILEVRRNPFWHQRPPYVVARDEWEVGSFYPRGQGHRVKGLQHILNDFANQTNDNGTYALNPMWLVNPGLLSGPLTSIKPGGIWQGTDVNAMAKPILPPIEQLQYGFQFLNLYQGMLMDHIGAPPIIQGVGGGKGAKTATGSQILQKNAMNPLQDSVEDIENDVMLVLMEMCYSLNQQYRDEDSMTAIAGVPIKVPKEALAGMYAFKWLASSQAVNQQQRASQVMQLLQIIMPLAPVLAQSGYTVDPVPLLKKLYSDGFGFRNFDDFVYKMQAQAGGPVPGMPMPGMGGPPNAQPQRPMSFVEQGGGEVGMDAAPGEAEDGMAVRDDANQMAAMMGGFNNGEG